jgi:hypothetical protein
MTISIIGFAAAAVFLIVAIILFFRLNIPGVIGIVTGRTASKNIQKIWDESRSVDLATGDFDFFRRGARADAAPIPRTGGLGTGGKSARRSGKTSIPTDGGGARTSPDTAPVGAQRPAWYDAGRQPPPTSGIPAYADDEDTELLTPHMPGQPVTEWDNDETELLSGAPDTDDETQLLSETQGMDDETQILSETPGADDETQLLSETPGADDETQLLSETQGMDDETQFLEGAQGAVFRIVRSETSIHTDRVIR